MRLMSSTEAEFSNSSPPYNEALRAAGHSGSMKFVKSTPAAAHAQQNKRKRRRNTIWFNPPFSIAVQSNLTKMFNAILDKCFPNTHPYLGKLFNKQSIKLSYSTTRNVDAIIASHNKMILKSSRVIAPPAAKRLCNCRARNGIVNCPLNGQCLIDNVVYRCDVSTDSIEDERFYLGSCSTQIKTRVNNHNKSFNHERYSNETTLSTHIWGLKKAGKNYSLKWSVVSKAKSYHPLAGRCRLCTKEKSLIAANMDDPKCLNFRSELMAKCRHRRSWLLSSVLG